MEMGVWRRNHWTAGEFSKYGFLVVKEPDRTGPSFPGSGEHCPLQEAVGLSGFLSLRLPRSRVTCDLIATHGCCVISLPLCLLVSCGSLLPAPGASVCPPGSGPCRHRTLGTPLPRPGVRSRCCAWNNSTPIQAQ